MDRAALLPLPTLSGNWFKDFPAGLYHKVNKDGGEFAQSHGHGQRAYNSNMARMILDSHKATAYNCYLEASAEYQQDQTAMPRDSQRLQRTQLIRFSHIETRLNVLLPLNTILLLLILLPYHQLNCRVLNISLDRSILMSSPRATPRLLSNQPPLGISATQLYRQQERPYVKKLRNRNVVGVVAVGAVVVVVED